MAFASQGQVDPADTGGTGDDDVYLRDRTSATTTWVSRPSGGGVPDGISPGVPEVDEGDFPEGAVEAVITFSSNATNLEPGDSNGTTDVFRWDGYFQNIERISSTPAGAAADNTSVLVSAREDQVVFWSPASDLVPDDTNGFGDIFVHDGDVERASVGANGIQANQTSFATGDVSADGQLVAFMALANNLVPSDTNGGHDVFVRDRGDIFTPQDEATTSGSDDVPADARVDLSIDCGNGTFYPVAVGLTPAAIDAQAVEFDYQFDPSVACSGAEVTALLTDGFSTATGASGPLSTDVGVQRPLVSIALPTRGVTLGEYDAITLRGSAKDADDGEIPDSGLHWLLDGNPLAQGGGVVDVDPPSGGFPVGTRSVTLVARDQSGHEGATTVTFRVAEDADNDGVPATLEGSGCAGGSDTNPADGYADADGDGIGNADDTTTPGGPCTDATTYAAVVDVRPDLINKNQSTPPVEARIAVPFQNVAVLRGTSVRIARIGGVDVSGDSRFVAASFTVSGGVATATFDRAAVNDFLRTQGGGRNTVSFTVTGQASSGAWTLEGTDTVKAKSAPPAPARDLLLLWVRG